MTAPVAIFRDPIYDGVTDPTVVQANDGWWMFYTQRRALHPDPGPGVAWVHGSRVAVARSHDGNTWEYVGTLAPAADALVLTEGAPPAVAVDTHWAPEVIFDGERWRMYLTEIAGVPTQWPGHARHIVEYVSDDLRTFTKVGVVDLGGDRLIDAAVARTGDHWRLWFKDEAIGSLTRVAISDDLITWRDGGVAIEGRPHEGPYVWSQGGWFWMIVDEWRGMAVYRSSDGIDWQRQGGPDDVILGESDTAAGVQVGRHGMVVVDGDLARLFYFTHPAWDGSEIEDAEDREARRSAVFVAQLSVEDDLLICTR